MKLFLVLILSSFFFLFSCNNTKEESIEKDAPITEKNSNPSIESGYDSLLAKRLGADDYGMKKYVMALLKAGPNRPEDPQKAQELQAAHMANIQRLAEEGKLVVAGPFFDDGDLKGIYVFNVESIEEAEALTNSDPAIQTGSLVMELHPWYASAALVDVNNIHNKIQKPNTSH